MPRKNNNLVSVLVVVSGVRDGNSSCRHSFFILSPRSTSLAPSWRRWWRQRHLLGQVIWPRHRCAVYNWKWENKVSDRSGEVRASSCMVLFAQRRAKCQCHYTLLPRLLSAILLFVSVSRVVSFTRRVFKMELHWNYENGVEWISNAIRHFPRTHPRVAQIKQYRLCFYVYLSTVCSSSA